MKRTFIMLSFISMPAFSQTFYTQDRVNYVATLIEESNWEKCAKRLCAISRAHGNGECIFMETLGLVGVNLSGKGLEQASKLKCVEAIELEEVMEAQPRIGRSN